MLDCGSTKIQTIISVLKLMLSYVSKGHHGAKVYTRATELAVVALLIKQHTAKFRNLCSPVRIEPIDCVGTPSYIIDRKYVWIQYIILFVNITANRICTEILRP